MPLQFADLQQADAPFRSAEHVAEGHRITAEFLGQAFIDAAERPVHRRNQAGTDPVRAVGIEVDFQGIAAGGGMVAADAPVGAHLIAIHDGAKGRAVIADVETPLLAQGHRLDGDHHVPVELVADAGVHRRGAVAGHRFAGGAGATDVLGVGVAGQYQDGGGGADAAPADPVALQAAAGPRERIKPGRWGSG